MKPTKSLLDELFLKTLDAMTVMFTSYQFRDVAIENGVPHIMIKNGKQIAFLHKNCTQLSRATWQKNEHTTATGLSVSSGEITDEMAIAHLKSRGIYKILKQTEFIEV